MAEDKFLYENISAFIEYAPEEAIPQIGSYITDNLKYSLFDWQKDALSYFLINENTRKKKSIFTPNHLLFNMATGSGKTLVMAALILYYYKQGYRNFLFFVNQNNIVDKTEENFTNPYHSKYLFKQNIVIDNKNIQIKKVDTFGDETDDIQIKFTSIQQLHNDVYKIKEDNVLLSDLQSRDLILLGDEAHHLNSQTKKNKQTDITEFKVLSDRSSDADIEKSWEHTVIDLILNKDNKEKGKNKNALLEFTATIDQNKNVAEKYLDKIIYKFDIADFLKAGYTKEINLISSSFDKKRRVLQALLFNWYRWYIALQHSIYLKPVILFRSKTIDGSNNDYSNFRNWIDNLSVSDFDFLEAIKDKDVAANGEVYKLGQSRIIKIKRLLNSDETKVNLHDVVHYIKSNFKDNVNCIITNSKDKNAKGLDGKEKTTSEQDKLLNNLEDKGNQIRAIFTVQRLTEGWDVLNLFDIVRLYEGRDEGKTITGTRKAGSSTVSEVQLIGRGVRYYPFKYNDYLPNKRKFDDNLENDLRVLEELYFHSDQDERYISELKNELRNQKLWDDNKIIKTFKLKQDCIINDKYLQTLNVWYNKREDNPNRRKKNVEILKEEWNFNRIIEAYSLKEEGIDLEEAKKDNIVLDSGSSEKYTLKVQLCYFDKSLLLKAINILAQKDNSIYRFKYLKDNLDVQSVDDLFNPTKPFFGSFDLFITIAASDYDKSLSDADNLKKQDRTELLKILIDCFSSIENKLREIANPYIGTAFKEQKKLVSLFEPKEKSINKSDLDKTADLEKDLVTKDWYLLDGFHGTNEEISLVNFLNKIIGNFKAKGYDKVYLLRNEEVYKIFDFKTGKGFQPDFLLFLAKENENLYYQVFIEPKGEHLLEKDEWKNDFLKEITNRYSDNLLKAENKNYRLIGLPLYNEDATEKAVLENIESTLLG